MWNVWIWIHDQKICTFSTWWVTRQISLYKHFLDNKLWGNFSFSLSLNHRRKSRRRMLYLTEEFKTQWTANGRSHFTFDWSKENAVRKTTSMKKRLQSLFLPHFMCRFQARQNESRAEFNEEVEQNRQDKKEEYEVWSVKKIRKEKCWSCRCSVFAQFSEIIKFSTN